MLLIAGTALDAIATYFIFLPFLVPVALAYDWDLVWFGVIITLNVAIGACTPPTAVNLMVTCRLAGITIESTFVWITWMIAALTAVLLLVTFVPELALALPRWPVPEARDRARSASPRPAWWSRAASGARSAPARSRSCAPSGATASRARAGWWSGS
jgi:hypothetical protein